MQILAEIAMYPLSREYDEPILEFIRRLRSHHNISVTPGETSTVIRGEYEVVMDILTSEMRIGLDGHDRTVFLVKILNTV